jgi:Arc/MetJ family transcription regulator
MKLRIGLAAALALAACGKKDEKAEGGGGGKQDTAAAKPADAAPKGASAECQAKVDVFAQWYAERVKAHRPMMGFTVEVVECDIDAGWLPDVDILEIGKGSNVYDADESDRTSAGLDDKALAEKMKATRAKTGSEDDEAVVLAVDQGVKWERVVELAEMAGVAGYTRGHVVVGVEGPPRPPASAWHDKIKDHLFDVQEELYELCPPWGSYFFMREPKGRTLKQLAEEEAVEVPKRIAQCNCAVDLDVAREYIDALDLAPRYYATLPVVLGDPKTADAAAALTVSAAKAQTWSNVVDGVVAAAKGGTPVRFALSK